MPSTVVTALPATLVAGTRQLATGTPSNRTVHAPQTPDPQTSLVPVSRRSSRITSTSRASVSSAKASERPLMLKLLIASSLSIGHRPLASGSRAQPVCHRRVGFSRLNKLHEYEAAGLSRAMIFG